MYTLNIIRKFILKVLVFNSLVALTILNSILKIAIFFFGILAVPVAAITVIATCILGFVYGFDANAAILLTAAGILVGLKYLLPLIPMSFDTLKFTMTEYLYQPIIIKSPVRYTI